MSTRRAVPAALAIVFAFVFFGLGNYLAALQNADSTERLTELRAEVELLRRREAAQTAGTTGHASRLPLAASVGDASRAVITADVQRQLQTGTGHLSLNLLRDRKRS